MLIKTGAFKGNGQSRKQTLPFKPDWVLNKSNSAVAMAQHLPTMWCGRTNNFAAVDSFNQGIRSVDDGFAVLSDTRVNAAGVMQYWAALSDNGAGVIEGTSWMGNATADRVVEFQTKKQLLALIVKRDSARPGAIFTRGASADAHLDSSAHVPCITSLGIGQATITAALPVNELDGPGGLGEGMEALAIFETPQTFARRWVGDGTTNRTVVTSDSLGITMALVYRVTEGGGSARVKTADMAAGMTAPISAAVMQSDELYLSGRTLTTGGVTTLNVSGVEYVAICFCDKPAEVRAPAVIRSRGKRAVFLPGRALNSYINCGTADGPLLLSGASSFEWWGDLQQDPTTGNESMLLSRAGGSYDTDGAASWGIDTYRSADGTFGWRGPQFNLCVARQFGQGVPDCRAKWRTGIIPPFGKLFHVIGSHLGNGRWNLQVNGKLVKQRDINLATSNLALPNIASTSGHRTVIGARWTGSIYAGSQRMRFRGARVYNVGLTLDEGVVRYEAAMLGSLNDVTRGLAEEWLADNAGGNILPASGLTANDGTINLGSVITL